MTNGTTAYGSNAFANQENATAVGYQAAAIGQNATAIGYASVASGAGSVAIGNQNQATGNESIAIGYKNIVTGNNSGAFGDLNVVSGNSSYANGNNNTIASNNTFVLGNNVTVASGNDNAVVLGNNSTVGPVHNGNTLGGAGTPTGVVSVGAVGAERQIQNVAPGIISPTSTDAVNGSQIYNLQSNMTNSLNLQVQRMSAGIAQTTAMAMIPDQLFEGQHFSLGGGLGTYNGQTGMAFDFVGRVTNHFEVKAGVSFSPTGNGPMTAGVGGAFKW